MTPLPVTFSDLEGHFLLFVTFLSHIPREMQRVLSMICLHMNLKAHVACNFNHLFENEVLLKVSRSRTLYMW